jgi:hypothetical protein
MFTTFTNPEDQRGIRGGYHKLSKQTKGPLGRFRKDYGQKWLTSSCLVKTCVVHCVVYSNHPIVQAGMCISKRKWLREPLPSFCCS